MCLIALAPFLFVLQGCFNQLPIVSITYSPQGGAVPLTVAFSGDSSYDPDGDIVEYFLGFWVMVGMRTGLCQHIRTSRLDASK